ncbi:hypothetical protein BT69DRAFT_1313289 [Atractiella rhizophila]|nr:hypothetical protein BT69DRAFT_1313289 [Atractiella rhizophila]
MDDRLSTISKQGQRERQASYQVLLNELFQGPASPSDFRTFLAAVVNDSAGTLLTRAILQSFVDGLEKISDPANKAEIIKESLVAVTGPSFEEQTTALRLKLADYYENNEEWTEAAKVLQAIPLESGHRTFSDVERLDIYIRIVRLLLEDDDTVSAEGFHNRAALLINSTDNKETHLKYKLNHAKILDSRRKFVEAGLRYHEISFVGELAESDRDLALSAALNCAVLSPAGPARSRLLAALYRDERTKVLAHSNILSKMFLDHIIAPSELSGFAATLQPHQMARVAASAPIRGFEDEEEEGKKGPETLLDKAVMEHNLLSASRIYNNISFGGVGLLLGLKPSAAEQMARRMVDRIIMFEPMGVGTEGMVSNVAAKHGEEGEEEELGARETKRWDLQIRKTANSVEEIAFRVEAIMATV